MTTHYLRTQQVADALGVGVSTVKRWVDLGEIRASKTIGRHRLITVDEVLRFARSRQLKTKGLEGLVRPVDQVVLKADETIVDRLAAILKEGRGHEAKQIILSAHRCLGRASALADDLLGPVMNQIGHGWSIGTWDVFEEHQASLIVANTISEQIAHLSQNKERSPMAIGAGPEGDPCALGVLLGELTLREVGWNVRNLGPNLPLKSLARAVRLHHPRLIFLSTSHLIDPIAFLKDYAKVSEAARDEGATILTGGSGLPQEVAARLEDARYGNQMAFLEDVGRELLRAIRTSTSDLTES